MSDRPTPLDMARSRERFIEETKTIRAWVNHETVNPDKLYAELVHAVEAHDRMVEAQKKWWAENGR